MRVREFITESGMLIGPHQGRELTMMLNNQKPLSLISMDKIDEWIPYLESGRFVGKNFNTMGHPNSEHMAIAQPDQVWRIDALIGIYDRIKQQSSTEFRQHNMKGYIPKMTPADHIDIGKLLGYSDRQICAFINRMKRISESISFPQSSTCAIYSIAFVTGKPKEEVWECAQGVWTERHGLADFQQNEILWKLGFKFGKFRNDLVYHPYKEGQNIRHFTLRNLLIKLKENPQGPLLIGTRDHTIGYRDGRIMDTAKTGLRSRVDGVRDVIRR